NGGNPTFGLVYEPHHYDRTTFQGQLTNVNTVITNAVNIGHEVIPVVWGEWGVRVSPVQCSSSGAPSAACLSEVDSWLSQLSGANQGWNFWKFNNYAGANANGRIMADSATLSNYPV